MSSGSISFRTMTGVGLRRGERYGWPQLLGDSSGGVIAALIALPYGLAMASLMGLPPVLGVFTSILTAPIIALLGRNPVLIGGTASATVPFIAIAVRNQGVGGAAKVCLVASVIMMGFCVMRLGRHIARVPHAVVTGFSCGIGGMMLISQMDVILGVSSPATRSAGSTLAQLAVVLDRLPQTRLMPMLLGLCVIVCATLAARWSPRAPAPLIGVALAIALARLLGIHEKEIGALPSGLPPFVGFSWSPGDVYTALPSALALAFVCSVNILITSRVVEHFRGRHRPMRMSDADAELGAYGIANICGGMFGSPMSVGIPARSLAVVRCGGTTRLSNLLHAVFLAGILWVGSGFVSRIPLPALAGVTAWMGLCLLDWSAWRRLPKMKRVDAAAFLATAFAVLAVNAVLAVAVGCSLYVVRALWVRLSGADGRIVPSTDTA
ncbi:MAG TPA: SulP family inorganic anion transporter [Candidatus Sulfopaludibacter sp.]|nr:SulP family inorganic anion transporter [Candidatus Sulfopaludibacter sp.]